MLLTVPNALGTFEFSAANPLTTVNCTPGISNAEGSWTQLIASTAKDTHLLVVRISNTAQTAVDRNVLLDIGVGAASSEVELIANLIASKALAIPATSTALLTYVFPIYIPAGSRIAGRAQTDEGTARNCDVSLMLAGQPSRPEMFWFGSGVEVLGTVTNSVGTTVAAGGSNAFSGNIGTSAGDWHSLGTTTKRCNWWQIGAGLSNAAMNNSTYWNVELGVGDGSAVVPILRKRWRGGNDESIAWFPDTNPMPYFPVAAGATMYARMTSDAASPQTTAYALAYGVY